MNISNFKGLAVDLVKIKSEIQALQEKYDEKKLTLMSAYEELGLKTYEIEGTGVKIAKKSRTTVSLLKTLNKDDLIVKYPSCTKTDLDKKKLEKVAPDLFETKVTEFIQVTGL